ncbi:MarR family transcriptional regulator [Agrobacterium tumefaciens]|uniref:MarR family transcriptional regulator n=1 Tax=Agrobacterium tumefaciens TaxID=358 RepID=UPI001571CAAB|nr:MarR family transcriptional regulator [Agrobacterium tumefaciens]NTE36661.1 MarR family transcriptional regulator [Agrobacterium tumefaciens]NTE52172.1 MarR family transcriptional regulator [Agrobacterium tumefaciens]
MTPVTPSPSWVLPGSYPHAGRDDPESSLVTTSKTRLDQLDRLTIALTEQELSKMENEESAIWISIKDLAERKGVSKQAISQRVQKLEAAGLIVVRQNGKFREVDLVSYDRAIGETGNAFREQAAETKADIAAGAGSKKLRDAQAERAGYEARLKELDLAERLGNLVPIRGEHGLETALLKISGEIIRELGVLMNWVPDLMEASGNGEAALRRTLREKSAELRTGVATRLNNLAASVGDGPFDVDIRDPD